MPFCTTGLFSWSGLSIDKFSGNTLGHDNVEGHCRPLGFLGGGTRLWCVSRGAERSSIQKPTQIAAHRRTRPTRPTDGRQAHQSQPDTRLLRHAEEKCTRTCKRGMAYRNITENYLDLHKDVIASGTHGVWTCVWPCVTTCSFGRETASDLAITI